MRQQTKTDDDHTLDFLGWRVWLAEEVRAWRQNNQLEEGAIERNNERNNERNRNSEIHI